MLRAGLQSVTHGVLVKAETLDHRNLRQLAGLSSCRAHPGEDGMVARVLPASWIQGCWRWQSVWLRIWFCFRLGQMGRDVRDQAETTAAARRNHPTKPGDAGPGQPRVGSAGSVSRGVSRLATG
jgi:hypothetical protein